jgi:hypothetical protein
VDFFMPPIKVSVEASAKMFFLVTGAKMSVRKLIETEIGVQVVVCD